MYLPKLHLLFKIHKKSASMYLKSRGSSAFSRYILSKLPTSYENMVKICVDYNISFGIDNLYSTYAFTRYRIQMTDSLGNHSHLHLHDS